jgi:copper resistance protein B
MMNIQYLQVVRSIGGRGVGWWYFSMLMFALSAPALAASTPMDHSNMPGMDQGSTKDMQKPGSQKPQSSTGGMEMGPMQGGKPPPDARDPDAYAEGTRNRGLPGMDMADTQLIGFLLIDRLEFSPRNDTLTFDSQAWFGGDYNKLWLKAEGDRTAGRFGATRTEALWDRPFATYWSSQLGIRHDFAGGPGRNWAAIGVQGLARYWFDVEATAYVGDSGRTAARLEAEYDLLLTQRLILQPKFEANVYGKSDPRRDIGSGLSDVDLGLRLRYEIKRQFAPYIGISWRRKFGNTADLARAAGEDVRSTNFVAGVRMWF